MTDMEEQLKLRMWAGEYYDRGRPIVRLLADLALGGVLDRMANMIHIDTDFKED